MDRFGTFVVWRRDYPGPKMAVLKVDGTEADARGEAHEYAMAGKPLGNREYSYTEINHKVRCFVRAMEGSPDADGRNFLAAFTEEEHEQLDLLTQINDLKAQEAQIDAQTL